MQDGSNWYVYCSNNPLKFIDPTGLLMVDINGDPIPYDDSVDYDEDGQDINSFWPSGDDNNNDDDNGTYEDDDSIKEHEKKTPSKREKHEKGKRRKRKDKGREKGDKRRKRYRLYKPKKDKNKNTDNFNNDSVVPVVITGLAIVGWAVYCILCGG